MKLKKSLLIFISVLMVFFTFGCSSSSNTGSSKKTGDKVTITFMMWGNEQHQKLYDDMLKEFYKTHKNIKVNIESVPFPDYQQKITVLAAGNELPDIGWAAERMVPQFMDNNILTDVSSFKSDKDWDYEDFFPSTLDLFQKDGKLYGLPFSTPPMVIFYNKDLFQKAGLKTPNDLVANGEWTWDQFVEDAKKIVETSSGGNTVYGANFFRDWNTWIGLLSRTWSYGGDIFNKDMTKFTWNSEQGVDTLKMLQQMMFVDHSHPKAGEQVSFESGKIGMFFDVYSYVSNARAVKDFKWDIAPLPKGPKGRVPMLGQAGYVMFKGSKHPKEAKEVLKFFTSKTGIKATSTFFVPPRKSALESDAFLKQENNPPVESIKSAVIDQMDNARLQAGHVKWEQINNAIQFGFDQLFGQIQEPKQILDDMESKINPLLK